MSQEDRVGAHGTHRAPGEDQIGQERVVGGRARGQGPGRGVVAGGVQDVTLLDDGTSRDLLDLVALALGGLDEEQAQVLLGGQDLHGLVVEGGGGDDLSEDRLDLTGHLGGDDRVGGDDAAVGRDRVAGVGLAVGLGDVAGGRDRDAAGVGVLDDGDRDGLAVVVGGAHGCVGVGVVVVAHGLAVELAGAGHSPARPGDAVDGGPLVGVLPVAQAREAFVADADVGRRRGRPTCVDPGRFGRVRGVGGGVGLDLGGHPGRHGRVVGGGVGEGLGGQAAAAGQGEAAFSHGGRDVLVPVGAGHHGDSGVVLGGGAHHGGATDVDLLHAGVEGGTGGDGVGEGVEVDDNQVDGGHPQGGQLVEVVGLAAVGEDAGVDGRVEGLDPPLEALGEAGDLLHRGDGQARGGDGGGGGAGGDDLDTGVGQGVGEREEAGLVIDGDEGAAHGDAVGADEALGGDVGGRDRLVRGLRGLGRRGRGHGAPGVA